MKQIPPKFRRRQSIRLMLLGLTGFLSSKTTQIIAGPQNRDRSLWPIDKKENFKIAYILFDGITMLDFIGIYDPISRMKSQGYMEGLDWDLCAMTNSISDNFGLQIGIDKLMPDLSDYQMIIVPGGFGTRKLQHDEKFINWLKSAAKTPYKSSICTGSLLLGAAGFLKDRTATCNFKAYQSLEKYCASVSKERIVEDNQVITAGAVASSLDLGLYLCEKFVGKENTEAIRKSMDYYPSQFQTINK